MVQRSETPWSFLLPPVVRPSLSWVCRWPMVRADAPCVRVDGSWRGDSSRASTRKIRGGGGSGRLPVLACYTGGPRRLSPPGAEVTAGENRREVGCLSRNVGILGLLLRGRASSGWWRYTDLSKYG